MTGREFYTWTAGSCSIRLALSVVERLNTCLSDARMKADEEQGGILYGAVRDGIPEITSFEFFRSQHRRGIVYDLGTRERAQVARIVASRMRYGAEKPLGYFRTHLRPGMFLDQDDFSVMAESFPMPEAVALLVRPNADSRRTAGFFFWEEGDIDRRQTKHSFPFDTTALLPQSQIFAKPVGPRKTWTLPAPSLRWGIAALLVPALAAAVAVFHHVQPTAPAPQPVASVVIAQPLLEKVEPAVPAPVFVEAPAEASTAHAAPTVVFRQREEDDETSAPPSRVQTQPVQPASAPRLVEVARELPPASFSAPVLTPVREEPKRERSVLVALTLEPRMIRSAKGSEIRKVVGHVPLFGHPFKPKDEEFTPARPERTLTPHVPGRIANDLSREFPVDVRISIDSSGAVTTAEVLNGGGTSLANLAAETASAGSWHPAVLGDRQVPSEMILHYRFRPVP